MTTLARLLGRLGARIACLTLLAAGLGSCAGGGGGIPPLAVVLFNFSPGFGGVHLNSPLELRFSAPVDLDTETRLDAELRGWLAFATQKLAEIKALTDSANGKRDGDYFRANAQAVGEKLSAENGTDRAIRIIERVMKNYVPRVRTLKRA